MDGTSELGPEGSANSVTSFEEAKATLYGTISAAGAALEAASKRRKFTVHAMASYLERLQLDISRLSMIHVTGTKGKGSTCALAESVLRHLGFTTGLFTSPHLLEVTERVRINGKPLTREAFAKYFFEVWDQLLATRGCRRTATAGRSAGESVDAPADMPAYFHLLTLVGLWCFVSEGVDVCIIEVGMGGRFDATNVVPSPVACGVAMLDLDHTKVLGETLDEIAWEKGGIFKTGCRAFTVEQPRGGMSVLHECSQEAGCKLEVVDALPTHDPAGIPYDIGLAGEHQRVNSGLALRLCAAWMEERKQRQSRSMVAIQSTPGAGGTTTSYYSEGGGAGGVGGHAESSLCFQGSQGMKVFLRSAEVHKGLSKCSWPGRCQVFRPPDFPPLTVYLDGAHTEQSMHACLQWFIAEIRKTRAASHVVHSGPRVAPKDFKEDAAAQSKESQRLRGRERGRCVLWFYASHERDVVPLLEALASARASHASKIGALELRRSEDAKEEGPLFDEVCFMEYHSGRPSRFTPPTARELLSRHGVPVVSLDQMESNEDSDPQGHGSGNWQRTLEQVWVSLQARKEGKRSTTHVGTATKLLENYTQVEDGASDVGGKDAMTAPVTVAKEPGHTREGELFALDGLTQTDILCTGSLYAVAAALAAMKAEVS